MRRFCRLLAVVFSGFLAVPAVGADGRASNTSNLARAAVLRNQREVRVLFIGNSLTYVNDLPGLVQKMAAAGGVKVVAGAVTHGGYSLEDHWFNGRARQTLLAAHWDYVVLQQGPSSRPESQINLWDFALRWAEEARRRRATPALYMVWPYQNQKSGFELVSQSYRTAALASRAQILPAGELWHEVLGADPTVSLYDSDGLHPTPLGSYLAALAITQGLTGVMPRSVPAALNRAMPGPWQFPASSFPRRWTR